MMLCLRVKALVFNSVTQSRIIGAVRGAHSQLWGTIIPVCSLYAARMTGDLAHLQLSDLQGEN